MKTPNGRAQESLNGLKGILISKQNVSLKNNVSLLSNI